MATKSAVVPRPLSDVMGRAYCLECDAMKIIVCRWHPRFAPWWGAMRLDLECGPRRPRWRPHYWAGIPFRCEYND